MNPHVACAAWFGSWGRAPDGVAARMWVMSDLEPRGDRRLTRREREDRAYKLVLATGGLSAVAVVGTILAWLDVIGGSLPLLAAILAVICFVMLRRMLGGR